MKLPYSIEARHSHGLARNRIKISNKVELCHLNQECDKTSYQIPQYRIQTTFTL